MNVLRTRLRWIVTLWLLCHGSSLAAAPLALCCRDEMGAVTAAAAAGENDSCPLHADDEAGTSGTAETSATADETVPCVMHSTCTPSNAALTLLLGSVAVLPGVETMTAPPVTSAVVLESHALRTHVELPDAPPPRL
jgi:hypothetical protein